MPAQQCIAELPGTQFLDTTSAAEKEKLYKLRDELWVRWYDQASLDRLRLVETWREEAAKVIS